jgi:manganese/zinc/iron transport system permease protein
MTVDDLTIIVAAGLVATAAGLLGPFLVLRRVALLSDAVSHAVLPGIVLTYLVAGTRAPGPVIVGAALFAILCVLAIDALRATGLVKSDAAIGLVFPALFSLGVLGVTQYADGVHLDLDATIYGEIAFAPFTTVSLLGFEIARTIPTMAAVSAANLAVVVLLWKELKASSFDPGFAQAAGLRPKLLSRLLLVMVAITAVTAFESVGAILVVTLFIVPAATAHLLCDRLWTMVAVAVAIGWVSAVAGHTTALAIDASIAGAVGLVSAACFVLALLLSPRHGLAARLHRRLRARAAMRAGGPLPAWEAEPGGGP